MDAAEGERAAAPAMGGARAGGWGDPAADPEAPLAPSRRLQCPYPSNGTEAGRASPQLRGGVGTRRLGAYIRGAAEPSGRPRAPKPSLPTAAREGRGAGGEMGTPRGKGISAHSPRGAPHVQPPVAQSAGPPRVDSREPRAPAVRGAARRGAGRKHGGAAISPPPAPSPNSASGAGSRRRRGRGPSPRL